ncbi:MAG TPA: sigma-70 family RNA polymerase sigma factor [Thermoanaerobaculia bacterium]|nr:sigma-70 family RNA polymerase sigma factor [Thermoanaerobaculia bacterium]
MHPSEVLQANLRLIEGIVERVCRRARIYGADADDFASTVKLKLVENDYAVLRNHQGRSSLATYLRIVIERWLADETIRDYGRWHPSTEAVRMGAAAVLLESLVRRDKRSLDEALPLVRAVDPSLARNDLEAMLLRLPERRPRASMTDLESAPPAALLTRDRADTNLLQSETRALSARATRVIREALAALDAEDRTILRMRFGKSISIADISRMLRLPQRPLYRRIESLLDRLRARLKSEGIDGSAVADVLESASDLLNFGLAEPDSENGAIRQTREVS